ncbi:MAG: DUF3892 domain-containing protein [Pedobacter sp.]|nr:MAG: DUF3892 domain-containing protein [Pedobacter sp.]
MATSVQISCINKNDRQSPYERIAYVGGIHNGGRWKLSLKDAIKGIEDQKYSFYTSVNGHLRNVVIATRSGTKYLKTEADNDTPDNLLSLQECP